MHFWLHVVTPFRYSGTHVDISDPQLVVALLTASLMSLLSKLAGQAGFLFA